MKTILALFVLLTISFSALCQIPKGTTLVGGNAGLNYFKSSFSPNTITRNFTFSISPSIGWAKRDNVVVGIRPSFSLNDVKLPAPQNGYTHKTFGLAAFKKNYLPLGHSFMLFSDASAGGFYTDFGRENYETGVTAGIGGGLAFAASQRLLFTLSVPTALGATAKYGSKRLDPALESERHFTFTLNSNVSLNNLQVGVFFMRRR